MSLITTFNKICRLLIKTLEPLSKLVAVLVALTALGAGLWLSCPTIADITGKHGAMDRPPALFDKSAVAYLQPSGQYESLAAAVNAARYAAEPSAGTAAVTNQANQMRARFTPEGVQLESTAKDKRWASRWRLQGLRYGDHQLTVGDGVVRSAGSRVTIEHPLATDPSCLPASSIVVEEWFDNTPQGLEHGFTLPARPATTAHDLRLTIAIDGDLTAEADANGQSLRLMNRQGDPELNYDKLWVWDADGKEIVARMMTETGALVLEVEDAAAKYPLVIDPTFSAAAKLVANDGAAADRLGESVAISDDTVIVGAPEDDIGADVNQGSAYIFVRGANGLWSRQAKLTDPNGSANDEFGKSVAISGNTAVVGAPGDDIGTNADMGSVYVYLRTGTEWLLEQKLTPSDGGENEHFGISVAISGNTLVAGAYRYSTGGASNPGSAYVFVRNAGVWTQQQELAAADGAPGDIFGISVAVDSSTVIVGASFDNINGNSQQGSAYVFTRAGTTWTQQQKLLASDGDAGDYFGSTVGIDTGVLSLATVVIGVYGDAINGNSNQGSAYVYTRSGTTWTLQQKLTASDGEAGAFFGIGVAISSGTVIIGADNAPGLGPYQGAAYIFRRSGGTTWHQRARLVAYDGVESDFFGRSVAIDGTTAVAGAIGSAVGANGSQGAAFVYRSLSKPFDFDDDGRADISVFRPSNATWYLQNSSAGFTAVQFGLATDQLAAGDYDGDGATDVAVFRGSVGTWYLLQSTAGFTSIQFGQQGDLAKPGDVDGDGKADVRVFRPSTGAWYWLNSSNGQFNGIQFGTGGDLPIVGDFDGDRRADVAVFRSSTAAWYLLQTSAGFAAAQFGSSSDVAVAGDFDGDGKTDISVFRPSTGAWYRLDSSTGQFVGITFGQNGDIPAPADFEGDGKTDLAVFRPSNGAWYLLNSAGFTAISFGLAGDQPVSSQP